MVRVECWERNLADFLKERRKMPFEWGVNDCMAFTALAVGAITETEIFEAYRGYSTEEQAAAILQAEGGMRKLLCKHFGPGFSNYLQAKRGDVVLFMGPHLTCGIVDDSGAHIVSVGPGGMVRLPLKMAKRIWSY